MNLGETVNIVLTAKKDFDTWSKPVIESLKDQTIALSDRWDAFVKLVEADVFDEIESYGHGFIDDLGNLTMYDDFHTDRGETVTYVDMYEQIMDADGDYQKRLVEARENNLEKWQELVLQSGFSGFRYDW